MATQPLVDNDGIADPCLSLDLHDFYNSPSGVPAGTFLHKGYYDLISLLHTPSPSRLMWGPLTQPPVYSFVAGPRYETIVSGSTRPSPPTVVRKGHRINKAVISKPTGFIHLVHASNADQLEELLIRWGPDGIGKLGDPRWAAPIKDFVRRNSQGRTINQRIDGSVYSQDNHGCALHVVNGMSTLTSSTLTTAAQENISLISAQEGKPKKNQDHSTIRVAAGLPVHVELKESECFHIDVLPPVSRQSQPRAINPSLHTLDKAVSARIYFENLYFPLLRQMPSREQRRMAMEKDMKELQLNHSQKEHLRALWRQNESDYLRERRQKVDASAFLKLKTIGHGAFGVVSLVKEQGTGNIYAMKQLRKADMLRKGQEGHVRAERDILKSASMVPSGAEWIVRLYYSFQDRDHLYLVLEFMAGGDLLNLLIARDVFEEEFTRFYVSEMLLSIEACHKQGFIHRDIKPDNFLFDPEGHIKLSDFGLATDLHWAHDTSYYEQQRLQLLHKHGIDLELFTSFADQHKTHRMSLKDIGLLTNMDGQGGLFTWRDKNRRKLAYSICGTNSYMSPEVIRGTGYTCSCDWWSLGVIMFECLYGFPPFVSNSRHITRQKILNWKQSLRFPSRPRVSKAGIDLMQQLLCEPEDRLGSQASLYMIHTGPLTARAKIKAFELPPDTIGSDGADIIKAHPWFSGVDWINIRSCPAPYKPDLRNPEDTRHFDDDIPTEPLAPANGAPVDSTKDLMLLDKQHGAEILKSRKALAFAGFTHKSPRVISYLTAYRAFELSTTGRKAIRGRTTTRETQFKKGRPISL